MTAKEKAKELFSKFYIEVLDREGTSAMNSFEAYQCALIANNELLQYSKEHGLIELAEFYEEVKQEIGNI